VILSSDKPCYPHARTLAEKLRGEDGVARLEGRIGKTLSELTRGEADE
jgi:hypothetical protein